MTDEPDHGTVRVDHNIATTLRYLPDEGYTGPDVFSYEISSPDGTAGPVTQAVTVDARSEHRAVVLGTVAHAEVLLNHREPPGPGAPTPRAIR